MSTETEDVDLDDDPESYVPAVPPVLMRVLLGVLAVLVVVAAATIGYRVGNDKDTGPTFPGLASVDYGFANDMSTHHAQAIAMASYVRDNTTDPSIEAIAYDIETDQTAQQGEMLGWLDTWGLTRTTATSMSWMDGAAHLTSTGLMPGMATAAQLNTLLSSTGNAMDLLFLQLMIHHHQGGIEMAQYAAQHASQSYVRDLAQSMYVQQSGEIVQMEALLRRMGGTELPPPAS